MPLTSRRHSVLSFSDKSRGALLEKAPRCFLFRVGSEEDFYRQLSDARVPDLSSPKGAKRSIAIELVKGADLVGAIYSTGADAFGREIGVVEDVEVFGAKLELPALREVEILGELDIPVGSLGEPKKVLPDVSERTKNRRVAAACSRRRTPGGDFGRLKRSRIEPTDALGGDASAGV